MKPIESIGVLTTVAFAVHLALFPGTAAGQTPPSADELVLEEVIVTAQRREQNVQDVPLSVSAISASSLKDGGVLDISRLKLLVPGMNFGQTGAYAHIAIRGARTEAIQVNTQPIVSNYIDGIYRSGTEQFLGPMVDLDRVEVLRGPQGTLFGKNSYGGAVVLYTNKPSQEFDASFKFTGGDYSRADFEGMVNFPLSDTVSARLVGAHFEHDGYVENTVVGGEDIDDQDADYIRGALLFEFENSSLILRGEYYDQGGNGSGDFAGSLAGSLINGDVFEVAQPFNTGSGCGSYSTPPSQVPCTLPVAVANNPYKIATDAPYFLDAKQETYSIEYNADYNWGSMKVLAAHTENDNFRGSDGDQGISNTFLSGEIVRRETDQVEIHFVDDGSGSTRWLIGAFYLKEDNSDNFFFNSDSSGTGFPFICITKRTVDSESTAIFGELTIPLSDSTRVTGGIRFSREENDWGVNGRTGHAYSAPAVLSPIPRDFRDIDLENGEFAILGADLLISDNFTPVTWRLAVDHDLSPDTLLYASVATGYSSGGFNSLANPKTNQFTFPENDTIAYEVGYKATLLNGAMTLNIAAFYNDFKDYAAEPATVLPSGSVIVFGARGGDAQAKGIDLELDWLPAENWSVNARVSILDAEFNNFVTGLGGTLATAGGLERTFPSLIPADMGALISEIVLDGRQIAYSPDFTVGITVAYSFELGGNAGTLSPLLQWYYSDDYSASDQGYLHGLQDAYSQTDLRLTWTSGDGRYNISGFVQNLEDEAVVTRANVFGATLATQQFAPPRTWGFSVGYNYR
ncbi:MAG: TonB-dependent receptor [Proteobacteria bacterium]|nr:TonB-dependent receptor [Pseudomonadota bacterium]